MSLNFENKEEIRLKKPPLLQVICQVRYSPILRISKEVPFDFQDAIRSRFPELEIKQGVILQLPDGGNKPLFEPSQKAYQFSTTDKKTFVTLAADFYSLASNKYTHWKNFVQDLELIVKTTNTVYQPSYATRIGLRFINKFTRKNTGSKSYNEILDLFREELTCLIRADVWKEPQEMISQLVVIDDEAKLAIRISYGKEQKEPFFLLDFDYYEEGHIPLKDLIKRLDNYHTKIYDAFRWGITEEGLKRFTPRSEGV